MLRLGLSSPLCNGGSGEQIFPFPCSLITSQWRTTGAPVSHLHDNCPFGPRVMENIDRGALELATGF